MFSVPLKFCDPCFQYEKVHYLHLDFSLLPSFLLNSITRSSSKKAGLHLHSHDIFRYPESGVVVALQTWIKKLFWFLLWGLVLFGFHWGLDSKTNEGERSLETLQISLKTFLCSTLPNFCLQYLPASFYHYSQTLNLLFSLFYSWNRAFQWSTDKIIFFLLSLMEEFVPLPCLCK